jgi:hypothetical protein
MPNVAAFCTSFKQELFQGIHAFGATVVRGSTAKDSFKAAAYLTSATLGAATTAYTITGEATGAGYVAGGVAVTNAVDPTTSGTVAYWTPSASIVFAGVSIGPVDAILLYNSTQANRGVGVFTFTPYTVIAGTITLSMPANAAATALLQMA